MALRQVPLGLGGRVITVAKLVSGEQCSQDALELEFNRCLTNGRVSQISVPVHVEVSGCWGQREEGGWEGREVI